MKSGELPNNRFMRYLSPRTNEVMLEIRREPDGKIATSTNAISKVTVGVRDGEVDIVGTLRDVTGDVAVFTATELKVVVGLPLKIGPLDEA